MTAAAVAAAIVRVLAEGTGKGISGVGMGVLERGGVYYGAGRRVARRRLTRQGYNHVTDLTSGISSDWL